MARDATRLPWPAARADYAAAAALGDCRHGVPGGDLIRPWCGSPGCALCRRTPVLWRTVWDALADRPAEVPPPVGPALFADPDH